MAPSSAADGSASPLWAAMAVPVTQKTASPSASVTCNGHPVSLAGGCHRKTNPAAASAIPIWEKPVNAAGGCWPMMTSRSTPPPIAVTMASTASPTMSNFFSTATSAADIANAKVPR
ncbi:Uncharacterised protein [Mycobacteroides abscessus subsp. abscessus]|nr:Uncharacterised protein [Mycobacteroides abscessus subsp. abscessus]